MKQERVLLLDNIRSTHNVGAIFRTADAIGISKIYLGGITPAPLDRFGRKRKDIAKSALGAEETVVWEQANNFIETIQALKVEGYLIIALEQVEKSVDYKTLAPSEKTAVIVGNEVEGVSQSVLDLVDKVAEIPMRGTKESLNVSVSTGILLYRLFDR